MKQTALITGASRGIGAALAETFAHAGYQLALCCHKSQEQLRDLADQLQKKSGKIPQYIGIILFGLQLRQLRILELLDHQHLPRPADGGVVENVPDLAQNHLNGGVRRQREVIGILLPVRPRKDGVLLILRQHVFHQRVQNRLLVLKMTVKRRWN